MHPTNYSWNDSYAPYYTWIAWPRGARERGGSGEISLRIDVRNLPPYIERVSETVRVLYISCTKL